jgi:Arylsulfatase A and related enzymes
MKKPNIVILIIDTLREDYSSGLEALRELGFVKYENAIAPAPWTLPSHASLITGMYPSQHEIHESRGARTNEELANIVRVRMSRLNYGLLMRRRRLLVCRAMEVAKGFRDAVVERVHEFSYEVFKNRVDAIVRELNI